MKKWKIGCIVVIIVLGLLVWAGSVFPPFHNPITRVIHIQTLGGPVPVKLVVLDPTTVKLEFSHWDPFHLTTLTSYQGGGFWVSEFSYSPLLIELEFYRSKATLRVEDKIDRQGRKHLVGTWSAPDIDGVGFNELAVTQLPTMSYVNWFDDEVDASEDSAEVEHSREAMSGLWLLNTKKKDLVARLAIYSLGMTEAQGSPRVEAEIISFWTTNRFFSGRVDGNLLRLASFENGRPELIHAELQSDGTLKGDLWSGDWEHLSWSAIKKPEAKVP
ncbi:MAG: hypothetical protein JKX70_01315 [Phycisphaerales bacterium]|nr:hypothetical protein [Phycisphaerales bacterium]